MFFKKRKIVASFREATTVANEDITVGFLLLFANELEDFYANGIEIKYGRRSLFTVRCQENLPFRLETQRLAVVEAINSETNEIRKESLRYELKAAALKIQFNSIIKQPDWNSSPDLVKKAAKLSKTLSRYYFKLSWLANDKQYDKRQFDFSTPEGAKKAKTSTYYRQSGITYKRYIAKTVSAKKKDYVALIRDHKILADIYDTAGHNDLDKVNDEIYKAIAETQKLLSLAEGSDEKAKRYKELALLYYQLSKNYRDQYHADFKKAGSVFELAKKFAHEANFLTIANIKKKDFFADRVNYRPYKGFTRSFRFWFSRKRFLRSVIDMYLAANNADGGFNAQQSVGNYKGYLLQVLHDMKTTELWQLYLIISRDKIQNLISSVSFDMIYYQERGDVNSSMAANTMFQLLSTSAESIKEELVRRSIRTDSYSYLTPFDDMSASPKGHKKSHRALRTSIHYLEHKLENSAATTTDLELKPVV